MPAHLRLIVDNSRSHRPSHQRLSGNLPAGRLGQPGQDTLPRDGAPLVTDDARVGDAEPFAHRLKGKPVSLPIVGEGVKPISHDDNVRLMHKRCKRKCTAAVVVPILSPPYHLCVERTDEKQPNQIKKLRKAKGLTQQQLGDRCGKTSQSISRYETGEMGLTSDVITALSAALDCHPAELFAPLPELDQLLTGEQMRALEVLKIIPREFQSNWLDLGEKFQQAIKKTPDKSDKEPPKLAPPRPRRHKTG